LIRTTSGTNDVLGRTERPSICVWCRSVTAPESLNPSRIRGTENRWVTRSIGNKKRLSGGNLSIDLGGPYMCYVHIIFRNHNVRNVSSAHPVRRVAWELCRCIPYVLCGSSEYRSGIYPRPDYRERIPKLFG